MRKTFVLLSTCLILFIHISGNVVLAQRTNSCILDSAIYNKVPLAAPLMRGDYKDLPNSHSLKDFTAIPKDQGDLGTCVGWTTAYMARTTMLAIKNGWTGQELVTQKALSPFFIYENIKAYDDAECTQGATLYAGLEALKSIGTVPLSDFKNSCNQAVTSELKQNAKKYQISNYKRLFPTGTKDKISFVKKSIAENKPVVIGVKCCVNSFLEANGEVWNINEKDDFKSLNPSGGHAVTVIGYDDNKYGGAFEIMNSWGTEWGNKGYIWVRYKDFNDFCFEAYEMIEKDDFSENLAGEIKLTLSAGYNMPVKLKSNMYEVTQPYRSGTLFRLYVANYQPAYIYIFSTDLSKKTFPIFPFNKNVSPYLGYQINNMAFPSEDHYIEMDYTKGLDYYCVLYSKEPLHLPSILEALEFSEGNFQERLYKVLGMKAVPKESVQFTDNKISFIANTQQGSIFPVIIAIPHQ